MLPLPCRQPQLAPPPVHAASALLPERSRCWQGAGGAVERAQCLAGWLATGGSLLAAAAARRLTPPPRPASVNVQPPLGLPLVNLVLAGPIRLEDYPLVETLANFDRERIPERVVHARGASAKGFFEVGAPPLIGCVAGPVARQG